VVSQDPWIPSLAVFAETFERSNAFDHRVADSPDNMAHSISLRAVALFALILFVAASNDTNGTTAVNETTPTIAESNSSGNSSGNTSTNNSEITTASGSCRTFPLRVLVFLILFLIAAASNDTNGTAAVNETTPAIAETNSSGNSSGNTSANRSEVTTASGSYHSVSSLMTTVAAIFCVISVMSR